MGGPLHVTVSRKPFFPHQKKASLLGESLLGSTSCCLISLPFVFSVSHSKVHRLTTWNSAFQQFLPAPSNTALTLLMTEFLHLSFQVVSVPSLQIWAFILASLPSFRPVPVRYISLILWEKPCLSLVFALLQPSWLWKDLPDIYFPRFQVPPALDFPLQGDACIWNSISSWMLLSITCKEHNRT